MFQLKFWKRKKEPGPGMKYLIVGLGNMGPEYAETRHNIGFKAVEGLARQADAEFKTETLGDIAEIRHRGRTLILLKPSTYMNRSGKAVRYWLTKKKIPQDRLLVVVDEINLPFGTLRLRGKGSAGGHNGLKDIEQVIGSNYARLRIGIGNDFGRGKQVDYVLGEWGTEEREELPTLLERAAEAIKSFVSIGLAHTMNQFNG
jgi:PTH1 family peptidyl-tRNA hydrolase